MRSLRMISGGFFAFIKLAFKYLQISCVATDVAELLWSVPGIEIDKFGVWVPKSILLFIVRVA